MSDDGDELDYHPRHGSGSESDHRHDDEKPSETPSFYKGATTFNPNDVANSSRYEELKQWQHETNDRTGAEQTKVDRMYDATMVCSCLDCTDRQQNRVKLLVEKHSTSGVKYEATILGVVTYVLNEDGRWIQREDELTPLYEELCECFGVDEQTIRSVRKTVRES